MMCTLSKYRIASGQADHIYTIDEICTFFSDPKFLITDYDLSKLDELVPKDMSHGELYDAIDAKVDNNAHSQLRIVSLALRDLFDANESNINARRKTDFYSIDKAIKLALESNNVQYVIWVYGVKSIIMDLSKRPAQALPYIQKSKYLIEELDAATTYESIYNNTLLSLTSILYQLNDYQHSALYGQEYMKWIEQQPLSRQIMGLIYAYDLVGASYKHLGYPDSSINCYERIISFLDESDSIDEERKELWRSIAIGNIGENLLNKNNLVEAKPKIEGYYHYNQVHNDILNILLSKNLYAKYLSTQKSYQNAIPLWRSVIDEKRALDRPQIIVDAAYGVVDAYRQIGKLDSALYYQEIAYKTKSEIDIAQYKSGLEIVNAQIEIERLEHSLSHTISRLQGLRASRNLTILSALLLMGIIFVSYGWKESTWRATVDKETFDRKLAEQRADQAINNLEILKESLIEKTELVSQLSDQLELNDDMDATYDLRDQISSYVFAKEEDWHRFFISFELVHPHFIKNLNHSLDNSSPGERRLAVLMKIGLNNKQLASALGIHPNSVSKNKYRLKQRLNLDPDQTLESFINSL